MPDGAGACGPDGAELCALGDTESCATDDLAGWDDPGGVGLGPADVIDRRRRPSLKRSQRNLGLESDPGRGRLRGIWEVSLRQIIRGAG